MNFIDISAWQTGINLATMFDENPLDGVIIKATEGTAYTNPYFKEWSAWLNSNGKLWGAYHFCSGGDAKAEANYFYNAVKGYSGKFVPCADYEGDALKAGTGWLKQFLDEYKRLSGVQCLIYCSQSVTQSQDFREIAKDGYRLWMAQYADMNPVHGFLENPWHNGSVAPFVGWQMQQYTSNGILNGWRNRLDLDKFYGNKSDWITLCGNSPEPPAELKPADPVVVADVLAGQYGVNQERVKKLLAAGYDPDSVQKKINELYYAAIKIKPLVKNCMDYLNSIIWIVRSI